jgi:hypothetical protein
VPLPDVRHRGGPFWRVVEQDDHAPAGQWLPPDGKLAVHAQGESEGCEDLVRGNSMSTIVKGIFNGDLPAAAACEADSEDETAIHDDEIDAVFLGPQFGAQATPHLAESKAGVWALRFRIERVEDDGSRALAAGGPTASR